MPEKIDLKGKFLFVSVRVVDPIERIVEYIAFGKDLADIGLYLEKTDFGDYQVKVDDNCNRYQSYYFSKSGVGRLVGSKYWEAN